MEDKTREENFSRARNILLGAVDTVLALASPSQGSSAPDPRPGPSGLSSQQPHTRVQPNTPSSNTVSFQEHRRLFSYKGKRPISQKRSRKKGPQTWKKECVCLRDRQQNWRPSSEEKIELARMGLGLRDVVFRGDGDAEHIHQTLLGTFPILAECGGYSLLRLGENSHTMVEIDGPLSVSYLKDILNHAKLYVRPLQKDITEDDMKDYLGSKVRSFLCLHY